MSHHVRVEVLSRMDQTINGHFFRNGETIDGEWEIHGGELFIRIYPLFEGGLGRDVVISLNEFTNLLNTDKLRAVGVRS